MLPMLSVYAARQRFPERKVSTILEKNDFILAASPVRLKYYQWRVRMLSSAYALRCHCVTTFVDDTPLRQISYRRQ